MALAMYLPSVWYWGVWESVHHWGNSSSMVLVVVVGVGVVDGLVVVLVLLFIDGFGLWDLVEDDDNDECWLYSMCFTLHGDSPNFQ